VPKIFELDPHVADLIAAGEVVERPASVVKELMENSIDAGAGIVTVEVAAGGMTFVRVSDNGCGIAPEDVQTAFLRHATSKLRDAGGLEAIGTLGFRGEALAAIAAVSRIELLTRETGAEEGVRLMLEAGEVVDMSPAGCPEGTTIIVRDLFFNTPARLKFMKSDRAESSAVASAVLRCALARPEVSVRFIRDGRVEYHTPGDSRVDSCIYSLLGREFSAGLLSAETSDETVSVTGFVSTPAAARGNRSYQFFFVNGRPIRSITLQAALEQAYANRLTSGRFPSCALYITLTPGDVDVNVHPAKTEVKFVSDKQVFDGVYYAALGALEREREQAPEREQDGENSGAGSRNSDFGFRNSDFGTRNSEIGNNNQKAQSHSLDQARESLFPQSGHNAQMGANVSVNQRGGFKTMSSDEYNKKYNLNGGAYRSLTVSEHIVPHFRESEPSDSEIRIADSDCRLPDSDCRITDSEFQIPNSEFSNSAFRVIGEALKMYIIVEHRNAVWFIDKHAAHERIHFNALRRDGYTPMSQSLITPIVCRLGYDDAALLLQNADMLENLGFSVESFGEDSIAVRSIPTEIDVGDAEPVLSEMCGELRRGGTAAMADTARRDNIYQMIACKAAIKAGKASGMRELEVLAARVISGEISHCPHGRPVAFEITKATLDKGFKRI